MANMDLIRSNHLIYARTEPCKPRGGRLETNVEKLGVIMMEAHEAERLEQSKERQAKWSRRKLSFRAPAELEADLEAAAAASHRSLSEEIEYRLARSFRDRDITLSAISSSKK